MGLRDSESDLFDEENLSNDEDLVEALKMYGTPTDTPLTISDTSLYTDWTTQAGSGQRQQRAQQKAQRHRQPKNSYARNDYTAETRLNELYGPSCVKCGGYH